jgi:hypothetical protein
MTHDPVRELREMDQLVYQMATAGSPEQLRSAVARAWAITEQRMRAESNRIGAIMEQEIRKTYTIIDEAGTVTEAQWNSLTPPPKLIGKT